MTAMFTRVIKVVFGIALIPFCIGFGRELAATAVTVTYQPLVPYWFVGGFLVYLVVHFLFRQPILAYVVGHELTHALFAVLFGGSVKAFRASERGGQVTITRSNFIITLAPYFFPLYTTLALCAYWVAGAAQADVLVPWIVLLTGGTFAFHLVLTAVFLLDDQKDIQEHGAFFSYPLILLFNIVLTALLIRLLLASDMDFLSYLANGIIKSLRIYTVGFTDLRTLFMK